MRIYFSVLCNQGGTSAVTVAGGERRAGIWWWFRSETSVRQESDPIASSDGDVQVIARAQSICERFPDVRLQHVNRS